MQLSGYCWQHHLSMFRALALLVAYSAGLLGTRFGVKATGTQLLVASNTTGIYHGEQRQPYPHLAVLAVARKESGLNPASMHLDGVDCLLQITPRTTCCWAASQTQAIPILVC